MITPEEAKKIVNKRYNLETLESIIDRKIRENHGDYPWEEAIVDEELPLNVRNNLAEKYSNAGWTYVYHHTSSENNERPGLTYFVFSTEPVEHIENNKKSTYHKIYKHN